MRLRDADKWTGELKNSFAAPNYHPDLGDPFQCMETEKHNEDVADLIMMIDTQSTAYDVDKVIDQIANKMFSAELYGDEWNGQTVNNLLCMGDVFEIVKGGGIDE